MNKQNTLPPGSTVKFELVYKSEEPPIYATGAFGGEDMKPKYSTNWYFEKIMTDIMDGAIAKYLFMG